jgi:hypothetical protein
VISSTCRADVLATIGQDFVRHALASASASSSDQAGAPQGEEDGDGRAETDEGASIEDKVVLRPLLLGRLFGCVDVS